MPAGLGELVEPPGGQARRPMGGGDVLARTLGDGSRQAERLVGLAVVEPAGRDLGVGLVELEAVEQALHLGLLQQPLGFGEIGAADVAANAPLEALHPAALGALQSFLGLIEIDRVQGHLGAQAGLHRNRPARLGGRFRLALQGQPVEAPGVRMVGVALQPGGQFFVLRAIVGRVEVALRQHVAEQDVVVEPGDERVGLGPGAIGLHGEDLPVALDVGLRQLTVLPWRIGMGPVEGPGRQRRQDERHGQSEPHGHSLERSAPTRHSQCEEAHGHRSQVAEYRGPIRREEDLENIKQQINMKCRKYRLPN
jgi:hypothetical protein